RVAQFDCEQPIDLIKDYAEPVCLELALLATQPDQVVTQHLTALAAQFALARHPQEWKQLHTRPALVARGVEELQRFAGLTRLLFRRAIADTTLKGLAIRKGERVILCLLAANRDPDRFPDPHELSVIRPRISHVSLGAGRNACAGAPLIRVATIAATLALVERFSSIQLVAPIE